MKGAHTKTVSHGDVLSLPFPYGPQSLGKKNANKEYYIKKHKLHATKKQFFLGIFVEKNDKASLELYEGLLEGIQAFHKDIFPVVFSSVPRVGSMEVLQGSLEDEVLVASMDAMLCLTTELDREVFAHFMSFGVVPIVQKKPAFRAFIEEFDPQEEQGNGFFLEEYTKWHAFAVLIRLLEHRSFSYDWNMLRGKVMESQLS